LGEREKGDEEVPPVSIRREEVGGDVTVKGIPLANGLGPRRNVNCGRKEESGPKENKEACHLRKTGGF